MSARLTIGRIESAQPLRDGETIRATLRVTCDDYDARERTWFVEALVLDERVFLWDGDGDLEPVVEHVKAWVSSDRGQTLCRAAWHREWARMEPAIAAGLRTEAGVLP